MNIRRKTLQTLENKLAKREKRVKKEIVVNNEDKYIPKSEIIKIYPTRQQKKILNDYLAAYRKTKNLGIHAINTGNSNADEIELRNRFVIKSRMSDVDKKKYGWLFRTPKRIREYAIKDLVSNYKTCVSQVKKRLINSFTFKPISYHTSKQNCSLPHEGGWFLPDSKIKITGGLEIKLDKHPSFVSVVNKVKIEHNMRLIKENDEYYISFPVFIKPYYKDINPPDRIVSIDPGVVIFGTWYCPDGEWGEIGKDIRSKLRELQIKYDLIKERLEDRRNLRKILNKIKRKIVNLVDDFHWKVVHWLLSKFRIVLISRLYVAKSNKLKDDFKNMKHCLFVDRLKYKSMFYKDREIHEGKEHYTTMACTKCFNLKKVRGDERIYNCPKCKFSIHRDLSAARNIFIKHTA